MIRLSLIALAMLGFASTQAFASASHLSRYFICMDPGTKKCQVVQTRPDGVSMTDVGKRWYRSAGNANTAMANLKACK